METENPNALLNCSRPDLALVRVAGPDARSFLHAQTTQSIDDMSPLAVRPAAWLSPKGRVLALFNVIASPQDFRLIVHHDNADFLIQALGRFILRARVTLERATDLELQSICGDIDTWLGSHSLVLPIGMAAEIGNATLVRTGPRCIETIGETGIQLPGFDHAAIREVDFALAEAIAAGQPEVSAVLRERYLPQMLNLDRLGAISFDKGCYPGQEIVARTTHLGQVKRRLQRFSVSPGERPPPGLEIVDSAGQPAGEINRSAASATGFDVLAVTRLDASNRLRLAPDGRRLEPRDLPYAL